MYNVTKGQGAQALDYNVVVGLFEGKCVETSSDLEPEPGSGLLDIEVSPGTFYVGGEPVEFDGGSVTLEDGDPDPRKDVVYVSDSGTLGVETGEYESARPTDKEGFDTYRPSPEAEVDGLVICEVDVEAEAEYVTEENILDRRFTREQIMTVSYKALVNSLQVSQIHGDIINNTDSPPLTKIDGPNLLVNDKGELEAPVVEGSELEDHDHSGTTEGGEEIFPQKVGDTSNPVESVHTEETHTKIHGFGFPDGSQFQKEPIKHVVDGDQDVLLDEQFDVSEYDGIHIVGNRVANDTIYASLNDSTEDGQYKNFYPIPNEEQDARRIRVQWGNSRGASFQFTMLWPNTFSNRGMSWFGWGGQPDFNPQRMMRCGMVNDRTGLTPVETFELFELDDGNKNDLYVFGLKMGGL